MSNIFRPTRYLAVYSRAAVAGLIACLIVGFSACNGDGPTENVGTPGIKVLYGAGVIDTIDAEPLQGLVVEVRLADGRLARGIPVRFEAQPPADPARQNEPALFVCGIATVVCGPTTGTSFTVETTDGNGVAKVLVRLGHVAGRAVVKISSTTPPFADSVAYTVTAGTAVLLRAPIADTVLQIGTTTALRGRLYDRYNNLRSDVPVISAGFGTSFSVALATNAVTANALGVQRLYFRSGLLTDSTTVTVLPPGRLVAWLPGSVLSVQLFNLDGSSVRAVATSKDSRLGVFPRFDPTGQRVTLHSGAAYVNPRTIAVVDTLGTVLRNIAPTPGFNWIIAQRQLTDGSIMVVGQRTGLTANAVWRIDPNDNITMIATLPGADSSYNSGDVQNTNSSLNPYNAYGAVDISPDGSRVAYLGPSPGFSALSLRVLTIATGIVTVLDANARAPRWSPQGDKIAYLVGAQSGGSSPITGFPNVIKFDGTGRREVGSYDLEAGLAWSPDGAHIIGRDQRAERLRVFNINTAASVLLSRLKSDYYQPDWQ